MPFDIGVPTELVSVGMNSSGFAGSCTSLMGSECIGMISRVVSEGRNSDFDVLE